MRRGNLLSSVLINLTIVVVLFGCTTKKQQQLAATVIKPTQVEVTNTTVINSAASNPTMVSTPTSTNLPQPTNTLLPTETATPVPTYTPTSSPSPLATQTITPASTPTPTEPPTPTLSPTPNMVMPGFFAVGGCATNKIKLSTNYTFCVTSVTVNRDRHMIFSVTWTLSNIPDGFTVTKGSDEGNRKMYLIDNLGNRYDHVAGGGDAYNRVQMVNDVTKTGWFEFGPPPEGSFSFSFYDDNNQLVLKGIYLTAGKIIYEDWNLLNYPLFLTFRNEIWSLTKAEDGSAIVSHLTIPACTIQERAPAEPQGKLKNTTQLGKATYTIYGYIDAAKNLGFREYIVVSGLSNLDPNSKPFFFVTIPLDNSLPCIQDVSELLATISEKTP
jgi:hypothetical protein